MRTAPRHLDPRTINRGDDRAARRGGAGPFAIRYSPFAIRHSAFTLTELVVSIGVLSLMMTMVGTIFKLTLDSTGEATSLTKVTQRMRLLEETLRKDLAQVEPASSIMVIQANPINAYWRTEHADLDTADSDPFTGYPHELDPERDTTALDPDGRPIPDLPRADVLMFFSSRKTNSYMHPAIWSNVVQVVYGHAEIGELNATGAWVGATPPNEFAQFLSGALTVLPTAAEKWHLARRSVLLVDAPETSLDQYDPNWLVGPDDIPNSLDDVTDTGGDNNPSGSTEPLQDGVIDLVDGSFAYENEISTRTGLGAPSPLNTFWFARSRMDLTPPALHGQRLGHYLLPHCASFKVEWAIDLRDFVSFTGTQPPRELVWIDPANLPPFGELVALANWYLPQGAGGAAAAGEINSFRTQLLARFPNPGGGTPIVGDAPIPVWFANDVVNTGNLNDLGDPDRYFPKALRITVDLYDDSGRFTRPMRHVMVLRIGSG